jgi:FkbM family methyltransferase
MMKKARKVTTPFIGRPAHHLPLNIRNDEATEKRLIREYFGNKRDGVFVEVGANDPTSPESQSFHLESTLGWSGLLVEPIPYLAGLARQERPLATVCECACTSEEKIGFLELLIPKVGNELLTGHASLEANIDEHNYQEFEKIKVEAITLSQLCNNKGIHQIDLLSIDVEGAEMDVLLGADLKKLRPRLILLEDKHLYLFKHRFLVNAGYVLAQRHNRNCWYVRKGDPLPQVALGQRFKLWKRMYISIWVKKVAYSIRHRTLKPFLTL